MLTLSPTVLLKEEYVCWSTTVALVRRSELFSHSSVLGEGVKPLWERETWFLSCWVLVWAVTKTFGVFTSPRTAVLIHQEGWNHTVWPHNVIWISVYYCRDTDISRMVDQRVQDAVAAVWFPAHANVNNESFLISS